MNFKTRKLYENILLKYSGVAECCLMAMGGVCSIFLARQYQPIDRWEGLLAAVEAVYASADPENATSRDITKEIEVLLSRGPKEEDKGKGKKIPVVREGPSADCLNMAFVFPEGASEPMDSIAGKAFSALSQKDAGWMAEIYRLTSQSPAQVAARAGKNLKQGENPKSWGKIRVSFYDGDKAPISGYSNAREILSLASVYAYYQDIQDEKIFMDYAQELWRNSHSYRFSVSDFYYCDGSCLEQEEEDDEEAIEGAVYDEAAEALSVAGEEILDGVYTETLADGGQSSIGSESGGPGGSSGAVGSKGPGGPSAAGANEDPKRPLESSGSRESGEPGGPGNSGSGGPGGASETEKSGGPGGPSGTSESGSAGVLSGTRGSQEPGDPGSSGSRDTGGPESSGSGGSQESGGPGSGGSQEPGGPGSSGSRDAGGPESSGSGGRQESGGPGSGGRQEPGGPGSGGGQEPGGTGSSGNGGPGESIGTGDSGESQEPPQSGIGESQPQEDNISEGKVALENELSTESVVLKDPGMRVSLEAEEESRLPAEETLKVGDNSLTMAPDPLEALRDPGDQAVSRSAETSEITEETGSSEIGGQEATEAGTKAPSDSGKKSKGKSGCQGHLDLTVSAYITGLKEEKSLFTEDSIGNKEEAWTENWQGWGEECQRYVRELEEQDWYDAYGLTVSTSMYVRNPLSASEISYYAGLMPEDTSQERKKVIYCALESVGRIPYYWGGKPSQPGYDGNGFGTVVSSDKRGRALRGLDCSGWVSWVFWTALGEHLPYASTSGFVSGGKAIERDKMKPGDLILKTGEDSSHVSMFLARAEDGSMYLIHEVGNSTNNVTVGRYQFDWPYYRSFFRDE